MGINYLTRDLRDRAEEIYIKIRERDMYSNLEGAILELMEM